jgi:hypothetical protein
MRPVVVSKRRFQTITRHLITKKEKEFSSTAAEAYDLAQLSVALETLELAVILQRIIITVTIIIIISSSSNLREVGCGGADWIDLAQDRDRWRALVYTVMNLRVP